MLIVTAQNSDFGQCIPHSRSRNVEGPTTNRRQSERRHYQATGGRVYCRWATRSSGL